jgi:hypothetical protein
MSKLLVKKGEELALYLIQKDEKEKSRKKIINSLNDRLNNLEKILHSHQNNPVTTKYQ